jgi:hypothetical protein
LEDLVARIGQQRSNRMPERPIVVNEQNARHTSVV